MNDLFFYVEEAGICNFGDGNTLHSWGKLLLPIVKENFSSCFRVGKHNKQTIKINSIIVKQSDDVTLSWETIDNRFTTLTQPLFLGL